MFDIGFLEIVLCGIVALVVLGPEKLPHAARMAGAFIGKFTRLAQSVREDIEREVNLMEMQERIKKQVEKGVIGDIKDNVEQARRMLREGYEQGNGSAPDAAVGGPAPADNPPAVSLPAVSPPADTSNTTIPASGIAVTQTVDTPADTPR
jgi:sec-independent protein translocase protein TatB